MAYHDYDHYKMQVYKKYVNVVELRKKDGSLETLEIIWDNGKQFKIEKFQFKQYGESRTGSGGKHYIIWIQGQQRNMYLEKDKWFIETYKSSAGKKNGKQIGQKGIMFRSADLLRTLSMPEGQADRLTTGQEFEVKSAD